MVINDMYMCEKCSAPACHGVAAGRLMRALAARGMLPLRVVQRHGLQESLLRACSMIAWLEIGSVPAACSSGSWPKRAVPVCGPGRWECPRVLAGNDRHRVGRIRRS